MKELSNQQQAIELLQKLGLKEYEAKCFVALSRLPKGTAKKISETSDVPRTRVYDAIRVLETKGLVEVQHSNPQQFRAVPVAEAIELLRQEYESRTRTLADVLEDIEPAHSDEDEEITHEVWSLSGSATIANRTRELIDTAGSEVVLIIGSEDVLTAELTESLRSAQEDGIKVIVGTVTEELRDAVLDALPDAETFLSGLAWLGSSSLDANDQTTISRLLLVDRSTILVSSVHEARGGEAETESAVFGRGFDNGIVVIARRLMATGLNLEDPQAKFS